LKLKDFSQFNLFFNLF